MLRSIYRVIAICFGLTISEPLLAAACQPPSWQTFVRSQDPVKGVVISMKPLASLSMPTGFNKIASLPSGSLAISGFADASNKSLLLMFETETTAKIHRRKTPYAMF